VKLAVPSVGKLYCWSQAQEIEVAGTARAALRVKDQPVKVRRVALPPSANHLWRRFGMGVGREYWRGVKASSRGKSATNNNHRRGHF